MEHEITLNDIFGCFKRHWWQILIFALATAILMGVFTHFFIPKKYSSSIDFYIINTNETADYAQTSLISANIYLANDYIDIINGDEIMNAACKKLEEKGYLGFTPNIINKKLSSSTSQNSSIFTITVTDTDPKRAYEIANVLTEIVPDKLTEITKFDERTASIKTSEGLLEIANNIEIKYPELAEEMKKASAELKESNNTSTFTSPLDTKPAVAVIYNPVEPTTHNSPSIVSNCFIAAVIGAIVSFAFFVIRSLTNTLIRNEDDIKKSFKYPLIGTIPSWDFNEKSSYAKTSYRNNK